MNLFRKVVASITLAALVVSTGATGVSAYSNDDLVAANGLAAAGVINDNSANPADYNFASLIMRNEAAKVAVNLDGDVSVKTTCDNSFADVSATTPNDWTCGYVEALLDAGKVSANENFNPLSNLTKSEATKMMLEAAGCTDVYTDAANWQAETVAFAAENDIVASFSDYNTPATRAFVFGVAYNAMNTCPVAELECDEMMAALGICEMDDNEGGADNEIDTPNDDTDTDTATNEGASVSLSPETPVDGDVAAGTPRTAVLAFDVTAGNEDLTLDEVELKYTGLSDDQNINELAIYLGNDKVTKGTGKHFDSSAEETLAFEKNTVINAGETKTLVLTATFTGGSLNESHQVTLTSITTKAGELVGTPLVSATLNPISVTNKGELELSDDTANETVTIGEEVKLAGFELEETTDKEDVIVKSITFTVDGSIDAEDDLADLKLLAEGVEIATDLTVNSDDEVIVDLEYVIPADEKVEFELRGTVTGSVGDTIELVFEAGTAEVYAVGATTGIAIEVTDNGTDIANEKIIEGSEINISFDKGDIDEAKPDATDVLVGTLTVSTDTVDYTITELNVEVVSTGSGVLEIIEDLELDGTSFDSTDTNVVTANTVNYTFEDVELVDGELVLPLTFDVVDDTALNDSDLTFTVKVVEVEDDEEDITYTEGGADDLDTILSSNSFDDKTISIETASFELTSIDVNSRDLVLGNGVEAVVYKGKISVGDADSVTINDMEFDYGYGVNGAHLSNSADLKDIIDTATLNIGGVTFDGDVNSDNIEFTNINAMVEAGADNVEVLVTVIFEDSDKIEDGDVLVLSYDETSDDFEDSAGDDLETANISINNTDLVTNTLLDRGTLALAILNDEDSDDNLENTVLAGTSTVTLAEIEVEAEYEDVEIDEITFEFTSSAANVADETLENVRLVNADNGTVIADGATVNAGTITFDNTFTFADADDKINLELVADINIITTEGGVSSAKATDITVTGIDYAASDVKGAESNDEITIDEAGTTSSEVVTIVPVIVNVAIIDTLGTDDKYATIEFTVDQGNNDLDDDDVTVNTMTIETASNLTIRNDDDVTLVTATASTFTLDGTPAEAEISSGDRFEIKANADDTEVRILANGITFTVDGNTYTTSNDDILNLGEYNETD